MEAILPADQDSLSEPNTVDGETPSPSVTTKGIEAFKEVTVSLAGLRQTSAVAPSEEKSPLHSAPMDAIPFTASTQPNTLLRSDEKSLPTDPFQVNASSIFAVRPAPDAPLAERIPPSELEDPWSLEEEYGSATLFAHPISADKADPQAGRAEHQGKTHRKEPPRIETLAGLFPDDNDLRLQSDFTQQHGTATRSRLTLVEEPPFARPAATAFSLPAFEEPPRLTLPAAQSMPPSADEEKVVPLRKKDFDPTIGLPFQSTGKEVSAGSFSTVLSAPEETEPKAGRPFHTSSAPKGSTKKDRAKIDEKPKSPFIDTASPVAVTALPLIAQPTGSGLSPPPIKPILPQGSPSRRGKKESEAPSRSSATEARHVVPFTVPRPTPAATEKSAPSPFVRPAAEQKSDPTPFHATTPGTSKERVSGQKRPDQKPIDQKPIGQKPPDQKPLGQMDIIPSDTESAADRPAPPPETTASSTRTEPLSLSYHEASSPFPGIPPQETIPPPHRPVNQKILKAVASKKTTGKEKEEQIWEVPVEGLGTGIVNALGSAVGGMVFVGRKIGGWVTGNKSDKPAVKSRKNTATSSPVPNVGMGIKVLMVQEMGDGLQSMIAGTGQVVGGVLRLLFGIVGYLGGFLIALSWMVIGRGMTQEKLDLVRPRMLTDHDKRRP